MRYRRTLPLALAAGFLLGGATPALANAIAPSAFLWPGVLPMSIAVALPASILAALLERPFLASCGIAHPFRFALQANFLSLIVGYLTLPVGVEFMYLLGPLWSLLAMGISIYVEGVYLRRYAFQNRAHFRWAPIALANAVSSMVLIAISLVAVEIAGAKRTWPWHVRPYVVWLYWSTSIVSLAVFLGSFFVPFIQQRLGRGRAASAGAADASNNNPPDAGPAAEGEPAVDVARHRAPP
jgi:hypothetical protein